VSVDIVEILKIDELASQFTVQFVLMFSWFDSRLSALNLKGQQHLNSLKPAEKELIWIPEMVFQNTRSRPETVLDSKTDIRLLRRGNATSSGSQEIENVQYFAGSENPFTLTRFYDTEFLCTYQMGWYPFDLQTCKLILAMKGKPCTGQGHDFLENMNNDPFSDFIVFCEAARRRSLLPWAG
jgi:hypothetical protein